MPPPSDGSPRWYLKPLIWVVVVAVALRLLVLSRLAQTPYFLLQMGDMRFYHLWAQRILEGQWTDHHAFYGLPGYAFLLAGFYSLAGASAFLRACAVGISQVLIEAATAAIIFKIASRLCTNERDKTVPGVAESAATAPWLPSLAGVMASLAWITFHPAQTFSSILMPTAWLVCAYWLGVWIFLRLRRASFWYPWLPIGIGMGVVSMLVATITFLVPLAAVRAILSVAPGEAWPRRGPKVVAALAILVGGMFIGASPAWIHNYYVAHDPVLLSAHSGLNFWMGNNPAATGYPKIPPGLRPTQEGLLKDSITRAEQAAGRPLLRSEVSRYWSDQANRYISEHRAEWFSLLGRKIRNFWNGFQYDDISVITLFQDRGILLPGMTWGFVAALGLAGLPFALRFSPGGRWVAAAVLLHMLAILPVFITERYRLAAAPGLIILGVYGLWRFGCSLQERRWAPGAIYIILLAGALFWTSRPVSDPLLLSLDPFNVGVKELSAAETLTAMQGTPEEMAGYREEAGLELQRAETHLQRAYAMAQQDTGIIFALGNLALQQKKPARAITLYLQTLALNPNFASALNNLGYLALQDHDWAEACRYLQRATAAEPESAKSFYLLAQAEEGAGDLPAARRSITQAVSLAPKQREIQAMAERLAKAAPTP